MIFELRLAIPMSFLQQIFSLVEGMPKVGSSDSFSSSKWNIRLASCPSEAGYVKYPLGMSPQSWQSCNGAYSYTWESETAGELAAISVRDVLKLSRSMGFCPQNRCQLDNISNSPAPGLCPDGLCYSKVESGRLSFGACCYNANGIFQSGDVVGDFSKSQPEPKPIYAHSRIKLNSFSESGFPKDFINANMVYPGLILAQCPISVLPSNNISTNHIPFQSTVEDNLIMIIEQQIVQFVQLAPQAPHGVPPFPLEALVSPLKSDMCRPFPFDFIQADSKTGFRPGISNFSYALSSEKNYYSAHFTVTAAVADAGVPGQRRFMHFVDHTAGMQCDPIGSLCNVIEPVTSSQIVSINVDYIWFMNWVDFEPPSDDDMTTIDRLTNSTVDHMKAGNNVVVSCLSGRGRSGTYASIVLGKLKGVKTVSDLVDTIVSMREHRDGLVEIPSQLRYACRLLGMDDPTHCGWACQVSRKVFAEKYLFSTSIQDISKGGILHWSPSPILLRNVNGAIDVDNGLFVLLLLSMLWSLLFGLLISNFLMTDFFRAKRCSKAFQLILFVCLSMIYILTLNSI